MEDTFTEIFFLGRFYVQIFLGSFFHTEKLRCIIPLTDSYEKLQSQIVLYLFKKFCTASNNYVPIMYLTEMSIFTHIPTPGACCTDDLKVYVNL